MQEVTTGSGGEPAGEHKVVILAETLVEAFGVDARVVVERQIEASDDKAALAIWVEIGEHLYGAKARQT